MLGPLLNPANANRQLIGVYSKKWMLPIANCLKDLSIKKAWVVHGEDGLDEVSTSAKTNVIEVKDNKIKKFIINPEKFGIKSVSLSKIKGRDPLYNANAIIKLFSNNRFNKHFKDIVLINTAAALVVADKTNNIKNGIKIAKYHLENGDALKKLNAFKKLTQ